MKGFEIVYRSFRSQMFFKIGLLYNAPIFTEKHLCWTLFLIKLQAFRPPTQVFSCECCEFFINLRWLILCLLEWEEEESVEQRSEEKFFK